MAERYGDGFDLALCSLVAVGLALSGIVGMASTFMQRSRLLRGMWRFIDGLLNWGFAQVGIPVIGGIVGAVMLGYEKFNSANACFIAAGAWGVLSLCRAKLATFDVQDRTIPRAIGTVLILGLTVWVVSATVSRKREVARRPSFHVATASEIVNELVKRLPNGTAQSNQSESRNGSSRQDSPKTVVTETIHVTFKTEFIDLSRKLDTPYLWALYRSGYGDTVSPVGVLAFVEVASGYSHPVSISSHSLSVRTEPCGWIYLSSVDARGVQLLWAFSGLQSATIINLKNHALDYQWNEPIPAYGTQFGMLLFETSKACPIKAKQQAKFRITITDSLGKSFRSESSAERIQSNFVPGSTAGKSQLAGFEFIGYGVDASKAHKRFIDDPLPFVINDEEKGTANILAHGPIGTVVVPDGIYIMSKSVMQH